MLLQINKRIIGGKRMKTKQEDSKKRAISELERTLEDLKVTKQDSRAHKACYLSFFQGVQLYIQRFGNDETLSRVRSRYVDYIARL